ncbi:MAG TPA: AI-2E family transporter [Elusimicrobiota bacterium]|jgi:predicted PurR-regulated permease PerM|nr:AI-2E family transporter [Elusimicrobiota bacterium]HMZ26781.1 AI-2E family transporter [Elusimicrobiota bacterium]HNA59478.1 AI-2E family transporter [Elusimicrobiota bacterium]
MSPSLFLDAKGDSRPLIFRIFFFAAFGFLLFQLFRLLSPFFDGIMVAITLALVFYPVHARFLKWTGGRRTPAAGLSVAALFLIVVIPTLIFLGMLGKQTAALYPWAQEQIQTLRANPQEAFINKLPASVRSAWERTDKVLDNAGVDIQDVLLRNIEGLGHQLSATGAAVLKNLVFFIFQTFVMLFTLFFLFRDGARLLHQLVQLIPMESVHKEHILNRLNQTLTAVVRGMFITASVQGLLAGIGFAVAGVRFSVLLGFATAFMALVPLVGATAVWAPVCGYLILKGWMWPGILLLIWSAGVVSTIDNFLRPYLIGEKARLPIMLLFFGTLGGLKAYGPTGIFFGPVMVASVLAFAKIYGEQLQRIQTAQDSPERGRRPSDAPSGPLPPTSPAL